ncbi:MAG: hypothetical protein KJ579_11635 [Verrucomicrobia bacterium]|jgi:hypothetical protein|nr:hypothetical protein [Verrucomicrobiota bacterium]
MERGAQQLVKIMAAAMLFGIVVMALRPEYRAAVAALWQGKPESSPVWISNAAYYPGIPWTAEPPHAD